MILRELRQGLEAHYGSRLEHLVLFGSQARGTVISCLFISSERYATEQSPLLLNVRCEGIAA